VLGLFVGCVGTAHAQEDDEYEKWLREQQQAYQDYLDEQDAAFLEFLEEEWVDVDVQSAHPSPIDDKPLSIPTADRPAGTETPTIPVPTQDAAEEQPDDTPTPEPEDAESEDAELENTEPDPAARPENADSQTDTPPRDDPAAESPPSEESRPPEDSPSPSPTPPEPADPVEETPREEAGGASMRQADVQVFGASITMPYPPAMVPTMDGPPTDAAIQAFWRDLAKSNPDATVDRLRSRKQTLALGDWGYYLALRDLSRVLYSSTPSAERASNAATLWVWGMLVQSGYAARVGYNDAEAFLMLPSNERLFDHPQLRIDGQRYYIITDESRTGFGSLRTYQGQHPAADRVFSFDLQDVPRLEGATETRTLTFDYDEQTHTVTVETRPAVLDYLAAYPDVELPVLFRAGMSPATHASVVGDLRPLVNARSEVEAVNLLLRFVQTAFDYKVDQESFGEERFLFPEETLGLPYSDCEDRSVLFAYLVRHLLGLQTAALSYPRHITTAVRLEASDLDAVGGYQVEIEGDTYVMADPTYINAGTGMAMPFVRGETPEVVSVQPAP
jgi:hypothetical protein